MPHSAPAKGAYDAPTTALSQDVDAAGRAWVLGTWIAAGVLTIAEVVCLSSISYGGTAWASARALTFAGQVLVPLVFFWTLPWRVRWGVLPGLVTKLGLAYVIVSQLGVAALAGESFVCDGASGDAGGMCTMGLVMLVPGVLWLIMLSEFSALRSAHAAERALRSSADCP